MSAHETQQATLLATALSAIRADDHEAAHAALDTSYRLDVKRGEHWRGMAVCQRPIAVRLALLSVMTAKADAYGPAQ